LNTHRNPRELAVALLSRSVCNVQVAAVLSDTSGIFSWGWNHGGFHGGVHAEFHALHNANRCRLRGARMTVAGRVKASENYVYSRPCEDHNERRSSASPCMVLIRKHGIAIVEYITPGNIWIVEKKA
jgi:pyrimidine deaminase RibD-like protein